MRRTAREPVMIRHAPPEEPGGPGSGRESRRWVLVAVVVRAETAKDAIRRLRFRDGLGVGSIVPVREKRQEGERLWGTPYRNLRRVEPGGPDALRDS